MCFGDLLPAPSFERAELKPGKSPSHRIPAIRLLYVFEWRNPVEDKFVSARIGMIRSAFRRIRKEVHAISKFHGDRLLVNAAAISAEGGT